MTENPGLLLTVAAFLLAIGPLVFVHELGHYYVGRWFGVKAEAFSIGFGRELFGFTDRRGTRWKFGWLPLGGYVRFAGDMNPASQPSREWLQLPPEERAQTFQAKPLWQRALIVLAGPATNIFVAILLLGGLAMVHGDRRTPPVVAAVQPGSAALAAGFQPGDRILEIEGRSVDTFDDLARMVLYRPGETLSVQFERNGARHGLSAVPATRYEVDRFGNRYPLGRLGIVPPPQVLVPVSLLEAPGVAVRQTGQTLRLITDTLGQVITGRRSAKELGGPLKIAQVSGEVATGGLVAFIDFLAFVSINLGFINLLPVPMLDGGHLFFYAVEAVRRKPADAVVMEWAFRSGLLLLLSLTVFVTVNDLGSFGVWRGLAGLIG